MRASKPLSPRNRTSSIAVPSGSFPKISRTIPGITATYPSASCSIPDKGFDVAAPPQHEGIRDMDQRRKIDIRHPVSDQFDETPIDAAILGLFLVDQRPVVMYKTTAPGRQCQLPRVGLDPDVPVLGPGLAPVE